MAKKKSAQMKAATEDERTINDVFNIAVRAVQKNDGNPRAAKIYDLSGNILRRRKSAACKLLPEVRKRYGYLYPDDSIVLAWAKECSAMGHSIDGADHLYYITLASAIWMLDELNHTGMLGTALPFFSKNWKRLREIPLPEMFDPCHNETVILGMMDLIRERDSRDNSYQFYINDTSAKRTEPVRHEFTEFAEEGLSSRERFNSVMSLIRPVIKERAVNRFLAKFWEFLGIYFECDAPLYKNYQNCIAESDAIMDDCRMLHEKILSKQIPGEKPQRSPLLAKQSLPVLDMETNIIRGSFEPTKNERLRIDDMRRLQLMVERGLDLEERADQIDTERAQLVLTAHMGQMISYEDVIENMGESAAKRFLDFEVDDPYEICFAYLCLIEEGSDIPWAYNGALAVLMAALRKLPWNATALEIEEELSAYGEMEEGQPDQDEAEHGSETSEQVEEIPVPVDWNDKKASLYRLDYGNDPLYAPLENPCPQWKVNIPQLIFGLTGMLMPRTVSDHDGMAEEFSNAGVDEGLAKGLELYLQLAMDTQLREHNLRDHLNQVIRSQLEEQEKNASMDAADREEIDVLRAQLKELKATNDTYRESAYQANREIAVLQQEMDRMADKMESERSELADLRELVFKHANTVGNGEAEQDEAPSDCLPYMVKKRVVVFGGHDTWRKAIKPLLPNVVFVNREQRPNANMIRAADVVWIQANALSHRSFYKIINVVRTSQVSLRYFGYASAVKCALQVAEDDMSAPD